MANFALTKAFYDLDREANYSPLSVEATEDFHLDLLMQIKLLIEKDVSMANKWDIWEWIHDESTGPCSFQAACAIEGCDPEEVVLGLHETLERLGIWIQRPTPLRRSYRKIRDLQNAGVAIEARMEDMPQYVGRIDTIQMDMFAPASAQEDVHG